MYCMLICKYDKMNNFENSLQMVKMSFLKKLIN